MFTTTCDTPSASASAVPPSVTVKSKTSSASPIVSTVVGIATGSATPAAAVRLPSESRAALVNSALVALARPASAACKLNVSSVNPALA